MMLLTSPGCIARSGAIPIAISRLPKSIGSLMKITVARWADILATPRRDQRVFLAEQGARLVGIGAIAAASEPAFEGRGEIKSLYIDPSIKRQGLGRRLMRIMMEEFAAMGYSGAALGVVVGNEPAIAFYRALGGQLIGRYTDPGPIWRSDNLIFAWDDLSLLS